MHCNLTILALCVCGVLAATGSASALDIYKWTDGEGITHYSDVQPEGVDSQLVPEGGISVIPGEEIGEEAQRAQAEERLDTSAAPARDVMARRMEEVRARRYDELMRDCQRNNGVDCKREVETQMRAERMLPWWSGPYDSALGR